MVEINSTEFGEITIDGRTYYSDVIVWWNGEVEMVVKKHSIDMDDLAKFMEKKPEAIIIGIGQTNGVRVMPEVKQVLEDKDIELYVEPSSKAIEIFNSFVQSKKKAVAKIHTTC